MVFRVVKERGYRVVSNGTEYVKVTDDGITLVDFANATRIVHTYLAQALADKATKDLRPEWTANKDSIENGTDKVYIASRSGKDDYYAQILCDTLNNRRSKGDQTIP